MSRTRALLRGVLLALAVAFAVGFGVGTWLRCRMERPTGYLGTRERPTPTLAAPPLPLDVRHARAVVLRPGQHEQQIREPVQVADRGGLEGLRPPE